MSTDHTKSILTCIHTNTHTHTHTLSKSEGVQEQEKTLSELQSEIMKVFVAAGFPEPSHPDALEMLVDIEHKLGELLKLKEHIPAEWIAEQEKLREKERRDQARRKNAQLLKEEQEMRSRKAQNRSIDVVKKKVQCVCVCVCVCYSDQFTLCAFVCVPIYPSVSR